METINYFKIITFSVVDNCWRISNYSDCDTKHFMHFSCSSIHGFPFVSRRDFHIAERIFWIAVLSLSIFCAYEAFAGQLKRYEENPTVLSVDIVSYDEFDKPAFTVCTRNYTNLTQAEIVIEKAFRIQPAAQNYNVFVEFVHDVLNTTYLNFENLVKYKGNADFEKANFLLIAREMDSLIPLVGPNYLRIMTELGMCQSSSNYSNYQSPYVHSLFEPQFRSKSDTCTTLEVCRTSVSPGNGLNLTFNEVYINSHYEVLSGDDLDYVELKGTNIKERTVKMDQVVADPAIRKFKPKSRKCRFVNEPSSEYFDIYTQNICKIDCRIKRSKKFCGCTPYFYSLPLSTKRPDQVCNITGMLCLSLNKEWFNATTCNCMNLCESTLLTKLSTKQQNLQFDRMLTLDLNFPKTQIVRAVVFDFDDLIVGFGGSVALFLGFSFLCAVESLFICIEALINLVKL